MLEKGVITYIPGLKGNSNLVLKIAVNRLVNNQTKQKMRRIVVKAIIYDDTDCTANVWAIKNNDNQLSVPASQ